MHVSAALIDALTQFSSMLKMAAQKVICSKRFAEGGLIEVTQCK
jgi:hypothetical protein